MTAKRWLSATALFFAWGFVMHSSGLLLHEFGGHALASLVFDALRCRRVHAQTVPALERKRPEPAGNDRRHDDEATSERSKMRVNSAYKSRIRSARAWAW